MVGANQFMSLSSQGRSMSSAVELGRKATYVVESAIEEAVYQATIRDPAGATPPAVVGDLNDRTVDAGMFLAVRQFVPGRPSQRGRVPGPDGFLCPGGVPQGADPMLSFACIPPTVTYGQYAKDADIGLLEPRSERNPVWYGIVEQDQFTGDVPDGNDSFGLIAFAHGAIVKAPGLFRDIDRSAQLVKSFKSVLAAPPWPFTQFRVFIRNPAGAVADSNFELLHKIYRAVAPAFAELKATYPSWDVQLPPFPLAGPNPAQSLGPVTSTTSPVDRRAFTSPALMEQYRGPNKAFIDSNQTFRGAQLAPLGQAWAEQKTREFRRDLAAIGGTFRRPTDPRFESSDPYAALTKGMLRIKSTVASGALADLTGPGKLIEGDLIDLTRHPGVYYLQNGFALDHRYRGRGMLICEGADGNGIRIKSIRKASATDTSSRLVLVSLRDIDVQDVAPSDPIQADLVAPEGTVRGMMARGLTIEGCLIVSYLQKEVAGTYGPEGPTIQVPPEYGFVPWRPGAGDFERRYAEQIRVYAEPGFVKRRYWTRRER